MNSSTSTSSPPSFPSRPSSAPDRRRALLFFGVLSALLGSVAAFVALVDPYGHFHAGDAANQLGSKVNLPLLTFVRLGKLPHSEVDGADVVILGDSRGDKITRNRVEQFEGHTILNLAIGGATFEEMLSAYDWRKNSRPGLRLVIITVPLERFTAAPLPNRCLEARPLADSWIHYLLNWEILSQSWDTWRLRSHPKSAPPQPAELAETPLTPPPTALAPAPASSPMPVPADMRSPWPDSTVLSKWKRMYEEYDPQRLNERIAGLQTFVRGLQKHGLDVVLWLPPLREDIRELIANAHLESERGTLVAKLNAIAPTIDLTASPGLGGKDFTFVDPVHTSDGDAILSLLLKKGQP